MVGLNYMVQSVNSALPAGSIGRELQMKIGSLGVGWFVNRIQARVRISAVTTAATMPTNATYTNWPQFTPFQLVAGVQSGATSYAPIDPFMANVANSAWWFIEEISGVTENALQMNNPPYFGYSYSWVYSFDKRYGFKAQAANSDWYLSLAYDSTVPVQVYNQFYCVASARVTYG